MISDSVTNTIQCPFAVKWRIPEGALLQAAFSKERIETNGCVASSNIPGVYYWLYLNPNQGDEEEKTWLYFVLEVGNHKKVEVFHVMKFEAANRSITKTLTFEETLGGGSMVCFTNELFDPEMKFIVDGIFTVEVTGVLTVEREQSASAEKTVANVGRSLWTREHDKDFVLVVGNNEIKVHKCILGSQSSVFDRMFETKLKEGIENKVVIEDFEFKIVETAIKLCYNKNLTKIESMDDAFSLLYFFDKYDIQELKAELEAEMLKQVSPSTVCQFSLVSSQTNCLELKRKCYAFLFFCLSQKIPILHVDLLEPDVAKKLIKESLYTVFK